LQSLHECRDAGLPHRIVCGEVHQHADAPHPLALLRARHERPLRRRAGGQRDELASLHVEHRASSPPWRCRSVYRTLNLPQRGRQVLGADLNCSELT
jgi:hypothetical protein